MKSKSIFNPIYGFIAIGHTLKCPTKVLLKAILNDFYGDQKLEVVQFDFGEGVECINPMNNELKIWCIHFKVKLFDKSKNLIFQESGIIEYHKIKGNYYFEGVLIEDNSN